ncbi:hypothetical protein QR680_004848 [Steinernema hermaphroditum]|nr:hypothetical protein QR680_004848 [Steinernema hermaphroditum]
MTDAQAPTTQKDHYLIVSSSSRKLFQGSTTVSPPHEAELFELLHIDGDSMKTNLCPKEVLDLLASRGFRVVSAVFTAWEEHVWTLARE